MAGRPGLRTVQRFKLNYFYDRRYGASFSLLPLPGDVHRENKVTVLYGGGSATGLFRHGSTIEFEGKLLQLTGEFDALRCAPH